MAVLRQHVWAVYRHTLTADDRATFLPGESVRGACLWEAGMGKSHAAALFLSHGERKTTSRVELKRLMASGDRYTPFP